MNPFPWERALDDTMRQTPDAFVLVGGPFLYANRDRILDVVSIRGGQLTYLQHNGTDRT